jgi:hypothetical protein
MSLRFRRVAFILTLLVPAVGRSSFAQTGARACLPNLPDSVQGAITGFASDYLNPPAGGSKPAAGALKPQVALVVALTLGSKVAPVVTAAVETQRTDKQIGSSASSQAQASATEKPGAAGLLALAIERGAVTQDTSGGLLTLSTSPYALLALHDDSSEAYQRNDFLTRWGVSASFDLTAGSTDPLASATANQLREWTVKFRVTGDHSARSSAVQRLWNTTMRSDTQSEIEAIVGLEGRVMRGSIQAAFAQFEADLNSQLPSLKDAPAIVTAVKCGVEDFVVTPLQKATIAVSDDAKVEIRDASAKVTSARATRAGTQDRFDAFAQQERNKPELTLALTRVTPPTGQNYIDAKVLYQQKAWSPMTLIANGGVSWNEPASSSGNYTLRAVTLAASLEGSAASPFVNSATDSSRVTISLGARIDRMSKSNAPPQGTLNAGIVQVKIDIPFGAGVDVPISFSASNQADLITETKKWRRGLFFGLSFDADKLFALTNGGAGSK